MGQFDLIFKNFKQHVQYFALTGGVSVGQGNHCASRTSDVLAKFLAYTPKDGKLQNRDELMLALIKALPEDMVADASAQKQFEMALKSANVPASAFLTMKVPDKIALHFPGFHTLQCFQRQWCSLLPV